VQGFLVVPFVAITSFRYILNWTTFPQPDVIGYELGSDPWWYVFVLLENLRLSGVSGNCCVV